MTNFLEKHVDWLAFGAIPKAPVVQASAIRPDNSSILMDTLRNKKPHLGRPHPLGMWFFLFLFRLAGPNRQFHGVQPFPSLSIFLGAARAARNLGKWWYFTNLKCSADLGGALPTQGRPKEDPQLHKSWKSLRSMAIHLEIMIKIHHG